MRRKKCRDAVVERRMRKTGGIDVESIRREGSLELALQQGIILGFLFSFVS